MPRRSTMASPKSQPVETVLGNAAKRLGTAKALRGGHILLHLKGTGGGVYHLDCSAGPPKVVKGAPRAAPTIEVIGDAKRILAIIEGKKDGRRQFLAGGIRVRGDLRYLSDLALELGIIKEPL
jgi:hypothetical protein